MSDLPSLTIEKIYGKVPLSGSSPLAVKISSCGQFCAYLLSRCDHAKQNDLWVYSFKHGRSLKIDLGDLRHDFTAEQQATRERLRIDYFGIDQLTWFHSSAQLLILAGAEVRILDLRTADFPHAIDIRSVHIPEISLSTVIKISPDDRFISYVLRQNIFLFDLAKPQLSRQLTTLGGGTVHCGSAEYIAQEEMHRFDGYYWSPDGENIAFAIYDEAVVDLVQRIEVNASSLNVVTDRYPAAGRPNVQFDLAVIGVRKEAQVRRLDQTKGIFLNSYFARCNWLSNQGFVIQIQNRAQDELRLYLVDMSFGQELKWKELFCERRKPWLNLHDDLRVIENGHKLVWTSEVTGRRQGYILDLDSLAQSASGAEQTFDQQLGHTPFQVQGVILQVIQASDRGDWVLARTNGVDPTTNGYELLRREPQGSVPMSLQGGICLLGTAAQLKDGSIRLVYVYSDIDSPEQILFTDLNLSSSEMTTQGVVFRAPNNGRQGFSPLRGLTVKQQFGSFENRNGDKIYYRLILGKGTPKAPLVVYVYGGPHVQRVLRQWPLPTVQWLMYLAGLGFGVLTVDNRGSHGRGLEFEKILRDGMGKPEVDDQVDGIRFVCHEWGFDLNRVGVFGWSYGGYMVLRSMLTQPEIFKVGVSVAPVTDFRLYDTHYTERYLGLPQERPDVYEASSCLPLASRLSGKLLMIHGMADDNVLYTHSTMMYEALQKARKPFDIMAYPGAKHGIYGTNNEVHLKTLATNYFLDWL